MIRKLRNNCIICDRVFKNDRGLQIHKSKIHREYALNPLGILRQRSGSRDVYFVKSMEEIFKYKPVSEDQKDLSVETVSQSELKQDNFSVNRKHKITKKKEKRATNL